MNMDIKDILKEPIEDIKKLIIKEKLKLKEGILPPDPARAVLFTTKIAKEVEDITPLPPIIDTILYPKVKEVASELPKFPLSRDVE